MDDIADSVEHTVLGPGTTWSDVQGVLDDAIQYGMRACIPPCFLERAGEYAPAISLTSVVAFPHGQATTPAKCQEAEHAWQDGADELDVVANLGYRLPEERERLERDLAEVVAAVPVPVKIIVEAPLLAEEELHRLCEAAAEAGVAYLKTTTGFTNGGASVDDVTLMAEYLPVKASGGINSWADAEQFVEAGATRIGSSSGATIVSEYRESAGSADSDE